MVSELHILKSPRATTQATVALCFVPIFFPITLLKFNKLQILSNLDRDASAFINARIIILGLEFLTFLENLLLGSSMIIFIGWLYVDCVQGVFLKMLFLTNIFIYSIDPIFILISFFV